MCIHNGGECGARQGSLVILDNLTAVSMTGDGPYGLIEGAAIILEGESIAWVGPTDARPAHYAGLEILDCGGGAEPLGHSDERDLAALLAFGIP